MLVRNTPVVLIAEDGSESTTCDILLRDHDTIDIVLEHVAEEHGLREALVLSENLLLHVGAESVYDTSSGRPLTICSDQTLAAYFKAYRSHHGLLHETGLSTATLLDETPEHKRHQSSEDRHEMTSVTAGPARLRLLRTLRVPDDQGQYALPPGLGTFPLATVRGYAQQLPEAIAAHGGLIMPMHQSEAMWISFAGSSDCAVKVFAGGVNALTGARQDESSYGISATDQDHLSLPVQPWIDGFCTEDDVVRQFIAAPLSTGHTVGEQRGVTSDDFNTLQFDIYPSLTTSVICIDSAGTVLDISQSPQEFGATTGSTIKMHTPLPAVKTLGEYKHRIGNTLHVRSDEPITVVVDLLLRHSLSKWNLSLEVKPGTTMAELKYMIAEKQGVPVNAQRLLLDRKPLDDVMNLLQCKIRNGTVVHLDITTRRSTLPTQVDRMGLAMGGQIQQTVYMDPRPAVVYDEEAMERLIVHAVSSRTWEFMTGHVMPSTPLTAQTYAKHRLPWFKIYDENNTSATTNHSHFDGVLSLSSILRLSDPSFMGALNAPKHPSGGCTIHTDAPGIRVSRPCSHAYCSACPELQVGDCCPVPACGQVIERLLSSHGDADSTWAPKPDDHCVTTLILAKDGGSPRPLCR